MTQLLLPPPTKRVPNYLSVLVRVPAGHPLPQGGTVTKGFNLTVQYGARWHPDWPEPRIVVAAYRFLPHGDAIGFTGERALMFPLPVFIECLAGYHGQPVAMARAMLAEAGISIPDKPEPIAAFAVREAVTLH